MLINVFDSEIKVPHTSGVSDMLSICVHLQGQVSATDLDVVGQDRK